MVDSKPHQNRKSIRLPNYDYTQEGGYFVTILTYKRECLFGNIIQGEIHLNQFGNIVKEVWQSIPIHFPQASVEHFVIMPNHVHGIVNLVGARHAVPLLQGTRQNKEQFGKPVSGSIPTIIRSFKSEVTRRVNIFRGTPNAKLWQPNYYEHVIRDEEDYRAIHDYILKNPHNWCKDDPYFIP